MRNKGWVYNNCDKIVHHQKHRHHENPNPHSVTGPDPGEEGRFSSTRLVFSPPPIIDQVFDTTFTLDIIIIIIVTIVMITLCFQPAINKVGGGRHSASIRAQVKVQNSTEKKWKFKTRIDDVCKGSIEASLSRQQRMVSQIMMISDSDVDWEWSKSSPLHSLQCSKARCKQRLPTEDDGRGLGAWLALLLLWSSCLWVSPAIEKLENFNLPVRFVWVTLPQLPFLPVCSCPRSALEKVIARSKLFHPVLLF